MNQNNTLLKKAIIVKSIPEQDEIFNMVCNIAGLDPKVVRKNNRSRIRELVYARQISLTLMAYTLPLSLSTIARYFNKDHATVIHSIKTVKNLLETDKRYLDKWGHLFEGIQLKEYKQ